MGNVAGEQGLALKQHFPFNFLILLKLQIVIKSHLLQPIILCKVMTQLQKAYSSNTDKYNSREYWCIYCTLFPLELKALGNNTLIEGDALVVALKKKSWSLTRRDRDANVYCGGWRDGMINSGGMRDLTSLFWTL